ncbi:hypothetical protein RRG08_057926 [Elysia crispata]|uniref:NADH dehydrogenase subunit 4 n=1 Tax=Elysia crispata TaxID=231223 RepID=A0AAE0Z2E4_9GAST|nr:hypothetical protein RRG08_057926 [Elysia crispata]
MASIGLIFLFLQWPLVYFFPCLPIPWSRSPQFKVLSPIASLSSFGFPQLDGVYLFSFFVLLSSGSPISSVFLYPVLPIFLPRLYLSPNLCLPALPFLVPCSRWRPAFISLFSFYLD